MVNAGAKPLSDHKCPIIPVFPSRSYLLSSSKVSTLDMTALFRPSGRRTTGWQARMGDMNTFLTDAADSDRVPTRLVDRTRETQVLLVWHMIRVRMTTYPTPKSRYAGIAGDCQ